jgi:Ca2+-binding RTX toxin-like protein
MRRATLLLASMTLALLLACGVALAATIHCPNRAGNLCVGTDNRDTMYGTAARDIMRGLGASDTLSARAGADRLTGGNGDDKLGGGRGPDVYAFRTGWGRDYITKSESSGVDTLDFTRVNSDFLSVILQHSGARNFAEIKTIDDHVVTASINFPANLALENVRGTPQNDLVVAHANSNAANHFWGYGGDDELSGHDGNDILDGGAGIDLLGGYKGDDTLTGGPDPDTTLSGDPGDDTIYAIDGEADGIYCGPGIDTVHYDLGLDTVHEESGNGICENKFPLLGRGGGARGNGQSVAYSPWGSNPRGLLGATNTKIDIGNGPGQNDRCPTLFAQVPRETV